MMMHMHQMPARLNTVMALLPSVTCLSKEFKSHQKIFCYKKPDSASDY